MKSQPMVLAIDIGGANFEIPAGRQAEPRNCASGKGPGCRHGSNANAFLGGFRMGEAGKQ